MIWVCLILGIVPWLAVFLAIVAWVPFPFVSSLLTCLWITVGWMVLAACHDDFEAAGLGILFVVILLSLIVLNLIAFVDVLRLSVKDRSLEEWHKAFLGEDRGRARDDSTSAIDRCPADQSMAQPHLISDELQKSTQPVVVKGHPCRKDVSVIAIVYRVVRHARNQSAGHNSIDDKGTKPGIWWDGRDQGVLSVRVPLTRSKDHRGYRDSGKLHANEWRRIQKAYPSLNGRQYIDLPRGRVVHSQGQFIVQMGDQSVSLDDLRAKIVQAFHLPIDSTVFVHDLEYDLRRQISQSFAQWLTQQLRRSDEVGFFARLALENDSSQLKSALDNPQAIEETYRSARGKIANSVRRALAEWRAGEPIPSPK